MDEAIVYGLSGIAAFIFLARSLVKIKSSDKRSYLNVFVNVVGTLSILALLYYKVNEFLLSWMITPN